MPRSGFSALHGVNPNLKKKKKNLWTYFDVFEKVFEPKNFIISKEKYRFIGGRPMPEFSMVKWLFDIVVESFRSYQTIRSFGYIQFVNSFV